MIVCHRLFKTRGADANQLNLSLFLDKSFWNQRPLSRPLSLIDCNDIFIFQKADLMSTRDLSGKTCKELGEYFGGITGPGITMRYNRLNNEMKYDKRLIGKAAKIKKQLIII